MFGLAQDVNQSLLGKDRMCDPPLIPDLKPSWDFLAFYTISGWAVALIIDADGFTLELV